MKKRNLTVLLLLLICSVTVAEIYKWVDESGKIQYGDEPPEEAGAQSVTLPEGPSQEKVERAKQEAQERKEHYEKFFEKSGAIESPDQAPQEAKSPAITPDNVACFTPLSDLVQSSSAEAFTPITPTSLGKPQKEFLDDLFGEIEKRGHWRGTVTDRECHGTPSEPEQKLTTSDTEIRAEWDMFRSRLTLRGIGRFEVGDFLYFSDVGTGKIIALDGNKVEILKRNENMVSFLIKRHIPTDAGTRRRREEIRHMGFSGRTFKLIELYYYDDMLTGSTTWILSK